jgi:hypothetical protein
VGSLARLVLPLAAAAVLSGCAAAAIAPLVAGGLVAKSTTDARNKKRALRAATPVTPADLAAADLAAAASPLAGPADAGTVRSQSEPGTSLRLTGLSALPRPDAASRVVDAAVGDPWAPFFTFALARAASQSEGRERSALLAQGTSLLRPAQRDCADRAPAVIIDLDPGSAAFTPAEGAGPAPGLVEGLARLRAAGVVVAWISQSPASAVGSVARALRDSGLDPDGRDPLLLVRGSDDRKQSLREEANRDVCVIAVAGDRRGDFDELFDYLRDPASASGLDSMLGSGWFLVSPPLG